MVTRNATIHAAFLNPGSARKFLRTEATNESRRTSSIARVHFIPGIVDNSDNKALVGVSYPMPKDA